MNRLRFISIIICFWMIFSTAGCGEENQPVSTQTPTPASSNEISVVAPSDPVPVYLNSEADIEDRVKDLLSRMNMDEKIGQMVQAESSFIRPDEVAMHYIGSVLSGGGNSPGDKSISAWDDMIVEYQRAAGSTRLGIPIIYGVDAVHGMAKFKDAVVFPHNSGLGAANDPSLMGEIGKYTAKEMLFCNVTWNFAPCVAVAQDIRWGRTYESYSQDSQRVTNLATPYSESLQLNGIIACAKHFFGDGATVWGTGDSGYYIDRGNVISTSDTELQKFLDPYIAAINSGVRSIMVSFNSINGVKMHENTPWVQKWLKDDMGFTGFVVSDWAGLQQINASDYHQQVVKAVNAGIDMLMEPDLWRQALTELKSAVNNGEINPDRIDDAVSRILRVKFENGLFDMDFGSNGTVDSTLSEAKQVARKAVSESLVLLKNDNKILPLKKNAKLIILGRAANDMPIQCGGWTMDWQGMEMGNDQKLISGTTILKGFQETAARNSGSISTDINDAKDADTIILVLGEKPHAEGPGDDGSLNLYDGMADPLNREAIEQAKATGLPIITILVSARPRIVTEELNSWNAFVMAWLPGSEGGGVADVLYGYTEFSGTLPFTWPKSTDYFNTDSSGEFNQNEVLFNYDYGMSY